MMLVQGGFQGGFLSKFPTFLVVEGSDARIYLLKTCNIKLHNINFFTLTHLLQGESVLKEGLNLL